MCRLPVYLPLGNEKYISFEWKHIKKCQSSDIVMSSQPANEWMLSFQSCCGFFSFLRPIPEEKRDEIKHLRVSH